MTRKGFTLVELLIVLLIISVLAAMLFPVFARARESARKTSCLSNVMELGAALQMYAADWQGALPPVDNDWSPLYHRMHNAEVLHCATDPTPVIVAPASAPVAIPYSSYIYRSGLSSDGPAMEILAFDREVWHLGGRNVLFLDGHGKWYSAAAFWQVASPHLFDLDPALKELDADQRKAARAGGNIPGRLPWR